MKTPALVSLTVWIIIMSPITGLLCFGDYSGQIDLAGNPADNLPGVNTDIANRMIHIQAPMNGGNTSVVDNLYWPNGGPTICRTNTNPGPSLDRHFFFDVDDTLIFRGNHPSIKINAYVYVAPSGSGDLKLRYDSIGGVGDDIYKWATPCEGLDNTGGDGTWTLCTFYIDDAYFGNRQHENADFHLRWEDDSHIYIDYVKVSINRDRPVTDEVAIDLGEDTADRMTHPQPGDGNTEVVQDVTGVPECRKNLAGNRNFYFAVDDNVVFEGTHPEVNVTVNYHDTNVGIIRLQYDKWDVAGGRSLYEDGGQIELNGDGKWHTHTFVLEDAYFGNGQNQGADFRIRANDPNLVFHMDKVNVELKKPISSYLGSSHVAGKYFDQTVDPPEDYLNEGAVEVANSGMRAIKLWLLGSPYTWNSAWPLHFDASSLKERASYSYFDEMFRRPIETYVLTIQDDSDFHQGFPQSRQTILEDEFYDLALHLIDQYQGTGKTFVLSHWEGDWLLRNVHQYPENYDLSDPQYDPDQVAIEGMINWLEARQEGVNRARADRPNSDVIVLHGAEVNAVLRLSLGDPSRPSVIRDVIPRCDPPPDVVSFSSWEATSQAKNETLMNKAEEEFNQVLEFIALLTPDSDTLDGFGRPLGDNNVFISEHGGREQRWLNQGWPGAPVKQQRVSIVTLGGPYTDSGGIERDFKGSLDFGSPWAFYWEVFDNFCCPGDLPVCTSGMTEDCCCPDGEFVGGYECGVEPHPGNYRFPSDFSSISFPEGSLPPLENRVCSGHWLKRVDGTDSGALELFKTNYLGTVLTPPVSFRAHPQSDTEMLLEWTDLDPSDETHFRIERRVLGTTTDYSLVSNAASGTQVNSYLDAVVSDTAYSYRIRSEVTDPHPTPSPWFFASGFPVFIFADGFESGDTSVWDYAGSEPPG